jgi:hypothetical protein
MEFSYTLNNTSVEYYCGNYIRNEFMISAKQIKIILKRDRQWKQEF